MIKGIPIDKSIYVEPISACNLSCKMCYANVRNGKEAIIMPRKTIIDFFERFFKIRYNIPIYWCGTGEVFLYPKFPDLINELTEKYSPERISHTIQTNGTMIGLLVKIKNFSNIELIVSIDAPKEHHDWNRGEGSYDRAIEFCRTAAAKGVKKISVRCLVTKDNVFKLREAEAKLVKDIGGKIKFYITKPLSNDDLKNINISSYITKKIKDDSRIMQAEELDRILEETYQNRYKEKFLDQYLELSLLYDGVYTCCDGIVKIGDPEEDIAVLMDKLKKSPKLCKEKCPWFKDCFPGAG